MKVKNSLNKNDLPLNTPLFCVYGPKCFPSIFSCIIRNYKTTNIWGYSVYQRKPGFRTLGLSLEIFLAARENPVFFANKEDAFEYLSKLITPRKEALK